MLKVLALAPPDGLWHDTALSPSKVNATLFQVTVALFEAAERNSTPFFVAPVTLTLRRRFRLPL